MTKGCLEPATQANASAQSYNIYFPHSPPETKSIFEGKKNKLRKPRWVFLSRILACGNLLFGSLLNLSLGYFSSTTLSNLLSELLVLFPIASCKSKSQSLINYFRGKPKQNILKGAEFFVATVLPRNFIPKPQEKQHCHTHTHKKFYKWTQDISNWKDHQVQLPAAFRTTQN